MRTLTTTFLALLLCFMLPVGEAHAKKLGGGFSLGKSYSAPKKPVAPVSSNTSSTTATKQQDGATAANSTAAKPRSGFGGLMGGLLAGGLLGALFFGGAFEGIQIMDVLLIAVVGFILFKLLSGRRAAAQPQPAYAGAGANGGQPEWRETPAEEPVMAREVPRTPEFGGGLSSGLAEAELQLPSWFNKKAFLDQACSHYTHLQRAWDKQDWAEIETYTSPELFQALQQERAKLPQQQETRVESVMAELINFIDEGEQVIVSIHFYGWMREDETTGTDEFSEIWHLSRDMNAEKADWFIVGIEQP